LALERRLVAELLANHVPLAGKFRQSAHVAIHSFAGDRGIPDTLGYARLIGLPNTDAIEQACERYRYAPLVFLTPPWKEIYSTDSERRQNFAEAERTFDVIAQVYRELGYQLCELPKLPPRPRAHFVLEQVPRAADKLNGA